jgi:hypothetical protein
MELKERLHFVVETAIQEFQALEAELPPDMLEQKGSLKAWTPRDDVIHCAAYVNRFAESLAWPRDHAREELEDYLKFNDEIWQAHQDETWAEALKMWEDACRAVLAGIEPLSESELMSNQTFQWLGEQAPAEYIPGLVYVHGMIHKQYIYNRLGRQADSLACADRVYQVIEEMDYSDRVHGRNLYNKACSYALAGSKKEAIRMLKEALQLEPNLVEWSRQDSDLESLRGDAEFEAIYQ